jgi:glycosyltransferase involved in cell wall biosynthesis
MKKSRILMVGPHRSVKGGIPSVVNSYYESDLVNTYDVVYVVSHVDGSKFRKFSQAIKGLLCYVKELITFSPDIVHIHISQDASTFRKSVFVLIGKIFRKRLIIHSHASQFRKFYENMPGFIQAYIRFVLNQADIFLVVCNYWKKEFASILGDQTPIKVLFNPVVVPEWQREYEESDSRNVNLLFLGRLGERKGIYDLLASLESIKSRDKSGFTLYVGGDGEIEKFKQVVVSRRLEDNVVYLGWVDENGKRDALRKSDIYVLPSYSEGLPVSILEAMSYGLPVISTPICGIPEAITDNENGFLVEPGDVSALADKIFLLMDNDEIRKRMGEKAYQVAKNIFSVDKITAELSDVYQSIMLKSS